MTKPSVSPLPLPAKFTVNLETMPLADLGDLLRRLATPLERINQDPPAGRDKEVATMNAAFALVRAVSARRHAAVVPEPVPTTSAVLDAVAAMVDKAAQ